MSDEELVSLSEVCITLSAGYGGNTNLDVNFPANADEKLTHVESRITELVGFHKGFIDSITIDGRKRVLNLAFLDDTSALEFITALAAAI